MATITLSADDDHQLSAYRSDPKGEARGAVVVIQEIFGVNRHIRAVADRFAAEGFVAVAPALFDRVETGVELDYDAQGVEVGREIAWNLPLDDALTDLRAAASILAPEVGGPGRVGAVGFCFGGMLAAAIASRQARHLAGAVAYYPSMAAQILQHDQPHIPLMVHLGDNDARISREDGEILQARWPDAQFHHYDAGHGFNCDLRPDHSPEASATAWGRTLEFLSTCFDEQA